MSLSLAYSPRNEPETGSANVTFAQVSGDAILITFPGRKRSSNHASMSYRQCFVSRSNFAHVVHIDVLYPQ